KGIIIRVAGLGAVQLNGDIVLTGGLNVLIRTSDRDWRMVDDCVCVAAIENLSCAGCVVLPNDVQAAVFVCDDFGDGGRPTVVGEVLWSRECCTGIRRPGEEDFAIARSGVLPRQVDVAAGVDGE